MHTVYIYYMNVDAHKCTYIQMGDTVIDTSCEKLHARLQRFERSAASWFHVLRFRGTRSGSW